ncbi:hypothetical protein [Halobacteriovorax sp. BALOs_7]|uniref:hypothetical protein n=1 Tax=Halobacteriovorax sp. BALOs_7 TaxID=2109558 RepID=UPI000EA3A343|nr:hypothetical protein [Halobacteriovorax sp. BALOs_7]
MKNLLLGTLTLLSLAANANQCANLEEIANTFKKDLKKELSNTIYPEDKVGQEEFRAKVGAKLNYLKGLKHSIEVCYEDYGTPKMYSCQMGSDLLKGEHHGNLRTTYTSSISVDYECKAELFLGHTITRNMETGKTIYMESGGMHILNTLYKCSGSYTNEEYSFRKVLLSEDNVFFMDQYLIYRTDVKVIAKKYHNKNDFRVEYTDSEVIFHYGDAFVAISKANGEATRSNFISMDELTEGSCQTRFDAEKNIIYPRTNIDEKRWGFELEYVTH